MINIQQRAGFLPNVLLLISMGLIVAGGVYFYIEQQVDWLPIVFWVTGAALFIICVVYKRRLSHRQQLQNGSDKNPYAKGRWSLLHWGKSSYLLAVVLVSIVVTVAINYGAYSLPYRWDITQAGQHTLTDSTVNFIESLSSEIEIAVLYVGLPPKYLEDLLEAYNRNSNGKISTKIIDPISDIGQAARFGNVIDGKESKAVVISDTERRDIDFSDTLLTEEKITNALVRVTRHKQSACFLTGHGEFSIANEGGQGLTTFVQLLASNNIASKNLMLGIEESIPVDCDLIVVAGPRSNLTAHEEGLIEGYLIQGGDALFLIESVVITTPNKPLTPLQEVSHPSLNSLLNPWGVDVGVDIVVDLSSHVGDDVGSPATRNYIKHKALTADLDYTFYVRPRSISVLENRRPTIKLAPIVLTQSEAGSWAETNRTLEVHFDEGVDIPGPLPISFVISEDKSQGESSGTRIIVFTDADFITNSYVGQYSNSGMALNVVNWLMETEYAVFLDKKEVKVERLDLTSKQWRIIIAVLFLMPIMIAASGVLVRARV